MRFDRDRATLRRDGSLDTPTAAAAAVGGGGSGSYGGVEIPDEFLDPITAALMEVRFPLRVSASLIHRLPCACIV